MVLHRVTPDTGYAVDSARTAADGGFHFRLPPGDTAGSVFLATTRYAGVLYSGPAIHGRDVPAGYRVVVYPVRTVARPDSVALERRVLVLRTDSAGLRVVDLIEMAGDSAWTLAAADDRGAVAPGDRRPSASGGGSAPDDTTGSTGPAASGADGAWSVGLPAGARDVRVVPGAGAAEEVRIEDGTARVRAVIPPGGQRLVLDYRLPAEAPAELTLRRPVRRLEVWVEGDGTAVTVEGLSATDSVRLEGRAFRREGADDLAAGRTVRIVPGGGGSGSSTTLGWLAIGLGALLALAALFTWRARRPGSGGTVSGTGGTAAGVLLATLLLGAPGLRAAPPDTAAPSSGAAAADTVVVEDDLGRRIRLASPPGRIVSLVPAVTELLFALGAGDRLVGRTRYDVLPPAARDVPSVGEGVRPSLERVAAREPDLVVLYSGAENRATARRLEELGLPTLALRHDRFPDLYRNLRRLGRVTGRRSAARELEEAIRCRLGVVSRATDGLPRRRVYYEVWSDPPITVGAGSYLDSLLSVAGAENVFGDLEAPSPRVSIEAVAARRPELILVPRRSGEGEGTSPGRRPGWSALEAVREGRVRRVDGDLLHRLGPRVGDAAAALARVVHPSLEGLGARIEAACTSIGRVPPPADASATARRPARGPRLVVVPASAG